MRQLEWYTKKLVRVPQITIYDTVDGYLIELNADDPKYQIAFTLSAEASRLMMMRFAIGKWERWKAKWKRKWSS